MHLITAFWSLNIDFHSEKLPQKSTPYVFGSEVSENGLFL
ncbi:unnamed protein product [Acanthoscelides obtectus]|uniref:Uncharacterized protein n=1 Tax=Acanthoscelides obtectus TaxID=200917 RepID=A0A9P0KNF2_ACAOB|nr:unnamed protein product [Acanthoscelides obtectus]CAK1645778.1 hypothetical protein AOBTE_LOCUS14264 [Acanthoscelides obtectus]